PRRGLSLFFISTALLCLLQASFHFVWFLVSLGIIWGFGRAGYRRVFSHAFVPLVLLVAVYASHYRHFGSLSLSAAHLWPNLRQQTCRKLEPAARRQLVKEGKVSKLCELPMFASVERVSKLVPVEKTGIPILDNPKRQNGRINFHHLVYLRESDAVKPDVRYLLRTQPDLYLDAIWTGFKDWFFRPFDQTWPQTNGRAISKIQEFWDGYAKYVYLQSEPYETASWTYIVFIPTTLGGGLLMLMWAGWRRERVLSGFLFYAGSMFIIGAVPHIFVAFVDLNRYRFRVECCLLYVGALMANGIYCWLAGRLHRVRTPAAL
ncbi:MAG: hypothetical protein ACI9OJ_002700, partial [Myxococcota bacterium]